MRRRPVIFFPLSLSLAHSLSGSGQLLLLTVDWMSNCTFSFVWIVLLIVNWMSDCTLLILFPFKLSEFFLSEWMIISHARFQVDLVPIKNESFCFVDCCFVLVPIFCCYRCLFSGAAFFCICQLNVALRLLLHSNTRHFLCVVAVFRRLSPCYWLYLFQKRKWLEYWFRYWFAAAAGLYLFIINYFFYWLVFFVSILGVCKFFGIVVGGFVVFLCRWIISDCGWFS
jgi:hypothetical protein